MNLLFSKNRKTSLIIICICVLFYSFKVCINKKDKDPFLTICKNSDAYYSYSYRDVSYVKNWSSYKKHISISNKLVINTKKGVENYAFLYLDEYVSNHIEKIEIKTVKADGSIVKLDSSLVFKRNSKIKKFGTITYPIPAVEPGDTIVTNYSYVENIRKYELCEFIYELT